jgi:hypothetical protein
MPIVGEQVGYRRVEQQGERPFSEAAGGMRREREQESSLLYRKETIIQEVGPDIFQSDFRIITLGHATRPPAGSESLSLARKDRCGEDHRRTPKTRRVPIWARAKKPEF